MFDVGCSDGSASEPSQDGETDTGAHSTTGTREASVDTTSGDPDGRDAGESDRNDDAFSLDTASTDTAAMPDGPATADARAPNDAARDAGADIRAGDAARDAGATDAAHDTGDAVRDANADNDAAPRADGGGADAILAPLTIWIAGDSTVQSYAAGNTLGVGGRELEGWGQELGPFFNDKVTISNQAIGGRSVAFFMWAVQRDSAGSYLCVDSNGTPQYELDSQGNRIDTAQWARIKTGIKPGDFLLIQFGTNDESHTCPRFVSLADFETDFGIMADTVLAKGATPIFVTPMGHRSFSGTTVNNSLLPYANAMKHEATLKSVQIADLNLRSIEYYATVGDAFLAANIFDTGSTHFIKAGATKMASLVAGEIRAKGGTLAGYLK